MLQCRALSRTQPEGMPRVDILLMRLVREMTTLNPQNTADTEI